MILKIRDYIRGHQKLLILFAILILVPGFYREYITRETTSILKIRNTEKVVIEKLNGTFNTEAETSTLFGDSENNDDLWILRIPLDRTIKKEDFSRKYKLIFYTISNKKYTAYLSEIEKEKVADNNRYMGIDKDNPFDSGRDLFYDICGHYYALENKNKYYSLSYNQSNILADILNEE